MMHRAAICCFKWNENTGPAVGLHPSILDDFTIESTQDITGQDGNVLPPYPPNVTNLVELDEAVLMDIILNGQGKTAVLWDEPLDSDGNIDPNGNSKTGLPSENPSSLQAANLQHELRELGLQANKADTIVDASKTRQQISNDLTAEQVKQPASPYRDPNTLWVLDPTKLVYNSTIDNSVTADGGDVRRVPDLTVYKGNPGRDAEEVAGRENRSVFTFDSGGKGFPTVDTQGGFKATALGSLPGDFHIYMLMGVLIANKAAALISSELDPFSSILSSLHLMVATDGALQWGSGVGSLGFAPSGTYTHGMVKLWEFIRQGNGPGNLMVRINGTETYVNTGNTGPAWGTLVRLTFAYPEFIFDFCAFGEVHVHDEVMTGKKLAECYDVTEVTLGADLPGVGTLRDDLRVASVRERQSYIDDLTVQASVLPVRSDARQRIENEIVRQTRIRNATSSRITR